MQVNTVLDKLSAHNPDIIGCIVTQNGKLTHNLRDPYEVVGVNTISEQAEHMLDLMGNLEPDAGVIDQAFLEMEAHSVYTRRVENGALVIVNKPMGRDAFRKVKIGVNLFIKPLEKAMSEIGVIEDEIPLEVAPPPKEEKKSGRPVRYYRGIKY